MAALVASIEHYRRGIHADSIGFAKPQGVPAIDGLDAHIGDTLVHDVRANLAGVTSVWMEPALPAELAPLTPAERAADPLLLEFLARQLEGNLYSRFHPEASIETARPDLVVLDVHEAAQALLERSAAD